MAVQKRSVIKAGKPAEKNAPSAEAKPLRSKPFTAHSLGKKKHTPGLTVTTLRK